VSDTPSRDARPWHERQPERLEWELAEFAARDLPTAVGSDGELLTIDTAITVGGQSVALKVRFPFDYPDVEPTVFGPKHLLARHQNRHSGNFCLLEDPKLDWWPTMSAAALVDEDLRWLIEDSRAGPDAVRAGEADMPEPLSQHMPADSTKPVLVSDPFWAYALPAAEGTLTMREKMFAGYILVEVEGLGSANEDLLELIARRKGEVHRGRWTQIDGNAVGSWPTRDDLLAAGEAASTNLLAYHRRTLRKSSGKPFADGWVAVTFTEEGPQRDQCRRGWLFMNIRLHRDGTREVRSASRVMAITKEERDRRIPELIGLASARVLVVGTGSVGAPLALELVKAGVGTIDLIDRDIYDPNNAVRHVLEVTWAGRYKAMALALEARYLNPFITVSDHQVHVGETSGDSEQLDDLIATADVVVDASGSQLVARILSRRCKGAHTPMVIASLTAGSYGAEVATFNPQGACYWCLVLGQDDGTIPKPNEGPRSNTTPIGCSTPAFSGAGFDATALAATAARAVVQATGRSQYPPAEFDYAIINFRGSEPWRQGRLQQHASCPLCT
jgi:molybdopterin/thiamine biosynthesis adenylyltransferase